MHLQHTPRALFFGDRTNTMNSPKPNGRTATKQILEQVVAGKQILRAQTIARELSKADTSNETIQKLQQALDEAVTLLKQDVQTFPEPRYGAVFVAEKFNLSKRSVNHIAERLGLGEIEKRRLMLTKPEIDLIVTQHQGRPGNPNFG